MIREWVPPHTSDQKIYHPRTVFEAGEKNHHISNTAYPIAHDLTWKPYRVSQEKIREQVIRSFEGLEEINLYTHIPFCETRCYFCEYTVVNKKESQMTEEYMQALEAEVSLYRNLLGKRTIVGFDIGGGTPSFVDAKLIAKHLDTIHKHFSISRDCEISIETTPKIASAEKHKMEAYHKMGIRRISMGIQVTEPDLLKVLGRSENGMVHHEKAMHHMREAGFEKINLDLMYGFSNQSLASWEHTLRHAIKLSPDYITLYRMRYKLTRISDQAKDVSLSLVKEQALLAKEILETGGYIANPGKNTYSKIPLDTGTSSYLTRRVIQGKSYLGLGLGAQSLTDNSISYNSGSIGKNLGPYLSKVMEQKLPIQDLYDLPKIQMIAKMISVSFYFGEINLYAFWKKFHMRIEDVFPDAIRFLLAEGYMEYTISKNGNEIFENDSPYPKESLSLTKKGAAHFNGCIALFYAPSVQEYLIARDPKKENSFETNQKLAQKVAERL